MKQLDYYFFGIIGLNIYLLFEFLGVFSVTNIIAVIEHNSAFAYVSVCAFLAGIVFILRNVLWAVSYVSGNFTEEQKSKMIHTMAISTFLAVASFVVLFGANVQIFYFFNSLEF